MKQNNTTKKLALAGVLTALAIVGSFISVPVAGSKCAPVQHMVNILACRNTWSCMGRWHCILCKFTPQSARSRKPYGFPWKHGRCFMLWSCLQKMPHLKSYLPCRSDRNRIPWRTCRLSGCFVSDGNCAGRTFRLCRSIPYFHCRRKHPCFHPDHSSGKRRRYVTDQRSIIIIHSYSTLL